MHADRGLTHCPPRPPQALRAVAARPLRAARLHSAVVRAAYAVDKKVSPHRGAMRQQRLPGGRPFAPASLRCHARRTHLRLPCSPLPPQGASDSMDYRIFFKQAKDGAVVSPWHDIPLYAGAPQQREIRPTCSPPLPTGRPRVPCSVACLSQPCSPTLTV